MTLAGFLRRRCRTNRGLLLAIAVGVLIACTVLAGAPTYLRSLELLGLGESLDRLGPAGKNVTVTNAEVPATARSFAAADRAVSNAVEALGGLVHGSGRLIRSRPLLWAREEGQLRPGPGADTARFLQLSDLSRNVAYVAGRPPSGGAFLDQGEAVIEAAAPAARAAELGLRVGDHLKASASAGGLAPVQVVIAGLFSALDPESEYWMGSTRTLLEPPAEGLVAPPPLPLFFEGDAIFSALAAAGSPLVEGRWFVYVDDEAVRRARPGGLASAMAEFDAGIGAALPGSLVLAGLDQPMRALERRLSLGRMPVLLTGGLLVAIAGYYLFMLATSLAERGRRDDAALRARGLTLLQLARLHGIEALALIALPAALAPVVAAFGIRLFALMPAYRSLLAGGELPVDLTWAAFAWAAAGAAGCLALLVGSALAQARGSAVAERQAEARPDRAPLFQRYFLDVAALLVGGLAVWDLAVRGDAALSGGQGQSSVNPLLVAAPGFLLIAIVLISLRLFAPGMRLLAWVGERAPPGWVAPGMWRFARRRYWYARPFALLLVATGTVVFAASLSSTLERTAGDAAAYEVGGDLRVALSHAPLGLDDPAVERIREVPGVVDASPVLRAGGRLGTTGAGARFQLLAIEPEAFGRVGWYRDDFAEVPLAGLLERITLEPDAARLWLPDEASHVGVWVRADPPRERQTLRVHLRDSEGHAVSASLGPLDSGEWQYRSAAIPSSLRPPVELTAVTVFETATGDAGAPGTVYLADLDATWADGGGGLQRQVLERFDGSAEWRAFPTSQGFGAPVEYAPAEGGAPPGHGPRAAGPVAAFHLGRGTDEGYRGIYRPRAELFPAIASDTFLAEHGLEVGDSFVARLFDRLAGVRVAGVARFFPTLDPAEGGFLIVDARELWDYLTLRGWTAASTAAEVIVKLDEPRYEGHRAAVLGAAGGTSRVTDRQELAGASLVTSLAVAGWRGTGVVGAYLAVIVAVLGYATHVTGGADRSTFESAVLQALGLSRLGFLMMTVVEHAGVVALGAGVGAAAGYVTTRVTVAAAAHIEALRQGVPPVVVVTDWAPVGFMYGAFAAAAALAVALMAHAFATCHLALLARREAGAAGAT